jgi:hypothetical protein
MMLDELTQLIKLRMVADGGFSHKPGGPCRADATAWAVLALCSDPFERAAVEQACDQLAATQKTDGRIPLMEGLATAYWATPLAILAWRRASRCQNELDRALRFILETSGQHFPREKDSPAGHDTAIRGWSWVEGAHSWLEPTALSLLALRANGYATHPRTLEAVGMIMDRQLPSGGWNYGNTTVYGQELLPMPEHTGQALCALTGYVGSADVSKSITYLTSERIKLQTPLSLCWSLFGLKAWQVDFPGIQDQLSHCVSLQERYGFYDTASLAQLAVAHSSEADLLGFLGIEV